MDPITQGALGAVASQSFARNKPEMKLGLIAGTLGGMAADLDVLIRSSDDPILFLEFHRQFTHSLVFIPFGGAIVAAALYPFFKKTVNFKKLWFFTTIGYATHALLDACTSYGTQLWWPFTNARVAWDNVAIIDPVPTLTILLASFFAYKFNAKRYAQIGLALFIAYLLAGVVQRERVETVVAAIAEERGHTPTRVTVKPTFANLILWRTIYEFENKYYVDAVKVPALGENLRFPGASIEKVDAETAFPEIPSDSQTRIDIKRFGWFSDSYLGRVPDIENAIGDVRYAFVPNEIQPLWGIEFDPSLPNQHVKYVTYRDDPRAKLDKFLEMLTK
ncbi:MAG: metal-dependent hydrolase [Bdellovibrionota bacterium]